MKHLILTVMLLFMSVGISQSAAVTKIVGLQGACDTLISSCFPIPLSVTVSCAVGNGCPIRSAPSYTSSLRFWGNNGAAFGCRTSSDGGVSWGGCTTQPLSTGTDEFYAGASDGSVIAAGSVAGTCTVMRSVDNGLNWVSVFTDATLNCTNTNGGERLFCAANGNCVLFPGYSGDNTTVFVVTSSNNGQSWTSTGIANAGSFLGGKPINNPAFNGSVGGVLPQAGSANPLKGVVSGGLTFAVTNQWPATGQTCDWTVVYNGAVHAICHVAAAAYKMFDQNGVVETTWSLPTADLTGAGGSTVNYSGTTLYTTASIGGGNSAIWVSTDGGASFIRLNTFVSTGSIIGSSYAANGCVYFSTGSGAFVKVC